MPLTNDASLEESSVVISLPLFSVPERAILGIRKVWSFALSSRQCFRSGSGQGRSVRVIDLSHYVPIEFPNKTHLLDHRRSSCYTSKLGTSNIVGSGLCRRRWLFLPLAIRVARSYSSVGIRHSDVDGLCHERRPISGRGGDPVELQIRLKDTCTAVERLDVVASSEPGGV